VWVARLRLARPRGFWGLKAALLLCPGVFFTPLFALALTPAMQWGMQNATTIVFLATLAFPALVLIVALLAIAERREGASRALTMYGWGVVVAAAGLAAYLNTHGLIGLRLWTY
jgi:hypothetical protein